jgi:hypothetical protein
VREASVPDSGGDWIAEGDVAKVNDQHTEGKRRRKERIKPSCKPGVHSVPVFVSLNGVWLSEDSSVAKLDESSVSEGGNPSIPCSSAEICFRFRGESLLGERGRPPYFPSYNESG